MAATLEEGVVELASEVSKEIKAIQGKLPKSSVAIGEYHFGGCSGAKTQAAGAYSLRVGFSLTREPKRFRISFENFVGLENYYSEDPGASIGKIYLQEESKLAASDFTYLSTPVLIEPTGGPLPPGPTGGAYITPWITPTAALKNKPLMLTYDLNLTQNTWLAYTYGSRGFITGPQSKATELTTLTTGELPWYETTGSFLTIKIEYEYDDTDEVTSAIIIGDSTGDGWEMSNGGQQGWRGQLTGFAQRWARQTGNTIAVNCFGTTTAAQWLVNNRNSWSPQNQRKWDRINPNIVPDVVIISLGGNDLQQGTPLATIQTDIMDVINKAATKWPGAQIYMCSIIPPLSATAAQLTTRESLNAWINELSPRKVAGVIDMSVLELPSGLADPRLIGKDGLHVNPRGMAKIVVDIA